MAKRYIHPLTGQSLEWPDSREAAKGAGFKRFRDGSTCSTCGHTSTRYVDTNYCFKCQFFKCIALHALKHADHLWDHNNLTCRVEYGAEPYKFSDEVYMELLEMKWRMDDDKSLIVHSTPCKESGHLNVTKNGKCVTCTDIKMARKNAKTNGDKTYKGKPCNVCKGTERITSTSLCNNCHGSKVRGVSARQQALKEGKEWYTPCQPCKRCNTLSLKRVNNGQCQGCQPVAKFSDDPRVQAKLNNKVNYIGEECTDCGTDIRVTSTGECMRCSL